MYEQIFDDGTSLLFNGAGDVVGVNQGAAGAPANTQGGSSLVQQFTDLFNYGARSAIDARFRTQAAQSAPGVPQTTAARFSLASPLGLALIVGGGALLFAWARKR